MNIYGGMVLAVLAGPTRREVNLRFTDQLKLTLIAHNTPHSLRFMAAPSLYQPPASSWPSSRPCSVDTTSPAAACRQR